MAKAKTVKTSPSTSAVLVTAMADFLKLGSPERCTRFAETAQRNRVSFSEMGKLHFLISEDIAAHNAANPKKKERTIYNELRAQGVQDKSISNASYASRAWRELVAPGFISEAAFDTLTFQDCFAIARSMSPRAALSLNAEAVGELIRQQPETFDGELASLYEHGCTVGEQAARADQAAAQEAARHKAEQAAKVAAAVEAERRKQTPVERPTSQPQPPARTVEDPPAANPIESADAEETPTAPPNVTQMPSQTVPDPDANLEVMTDVLAEIAAESQGFSAAAQQALLIKIDELRATVAARLTPAEAAA